MTLLHTFILGIVEGITEFLPVSSTAHLILTSHLLGIAQTDDHILFEIAVQLGAICAVVLLFYQKFLSFGRLQKLALAFIPTGFAGLFLYPYIKWLFNNPVIIGFTLLIGGIVILFAENHYEKAHTLGKVKGSHEVTLKQAFLLGCFQALAIIPGVSRSGAVIIGGLINNMERKLLTEFTFLLAVPTMLVATLYSIHKNMSTLLLGGLQVKPIVIGFFTSFIIATFVIKFFLDYIRNHSFVVFGIYRILLGAIVIVIFL